MTDTPRNRSWTRVFSGGGLTGCLLALAYPNFGMWPLVFVALVPLLLAIHAAPRRDRFFAGLLAGSILNAYLFHWLHFTLVDMSGLSTAISAAVTAAFAVASGLALALFALLVEPLARRSGRGWILVLTTGFVVIEWGFPHLFPYSIASPLYRAPLFVQVADITGIAGPAAAIVAANAGLARAVVAWRQGLPGRVLARWLFVPIAMLALLAGYGGVRMRAIATLTPTRELSLLLVQPNIGVEQKQKRGKDRIVAYETIVELTRAGLAQHPDVDAIVWPEGGFPFLLFPTADERAAADEGSALARRYSEELQAAVKEWGKPLVVGSLRRPDPSARLRNSAALLGPDGALVARHDKSKLVPIGEVVPLRDVFPALAKSVPGASNMDAGTEKVHFEVAGAVLLPSICYEAVYPTLTRERSNDPGPADAVVNLTNDVWFGRTNAAELHLMVQVMRTLELRLPLVRCTNTGVTALIGATGQVEARAPLYEAAWLRVDVPILAASSIYRRVGDAFLLALVLASLASLVLAGLRMRDQARGRDVR
jgi:apolipoprotein N-acyltransferase